MAQHVWMHLKADLGRVAGARDQLGEPSDGERRAPLKRIWPRVSEPATEWYAAGLEPTDRSRAALLGQLLGQDSAHMKNSRDIKYLLV